MKIGKNLKWLLIAVWLGSAFPARAADDLQELDRDPASTFVPVTKRSYPGGADEEELKVQPILHEVVLRTDARSLQKEVYKTLFNQDLKDERTDTVEE